jgi:hypothetical protein
VPTVVLASSLARWLTPSPTPQAGEKRLAVAGSCVREVLDNLFAAYPYLRGYVVDEAGAVRHHVVVYVNADAVEKTALAEPVAVDAEVYLFQALSGG